MIGIDEAVNNLGGILSYHILQFNGGVCDQHINWVCIGEYVDSEPIGSGIGDETSILV